MLLIGLLASIAHFLLILAFRHAQASVLQPFTYSLLVWATIVGLVAFREFPDGWTLIGALIVVAAGLFALHRERVTARTNPESPQA